MAPDRPTRRRFLQGPARRGSQEPAKPATNEASESADTYLIHFSRPAMGCQFEVLLNAGDDKDAAEAAVGALDRVEFLESRLSLYQPHSDLCQLNRRAGQGPQSVDDVLWQLLVTAEQLHRESGGAFDITMSPLSRLWGFHHKQGRLPSDEEIDATLNHIGMRYVRLDHEARTVELLEPEMELSFASLGKGLALDHCRTILESHDVANFLVHGGYSSVLARGQRLASESPGEGWSIALRDPDRPEHRLGRILLKDFAIGTSGLANQSFIHRGRRYGHLLDPRTGRPVDHLVSATALAPSGMAADALATAFFVMGLDKTLEYCSRHSNIGAILVSPGAGPGRRRVSVAGIAERHWLPEQ